ncbi:uncharacterized protein LOC105438990 [Strongylocentrotus purpuratus]|uniref:Death domain-containing protein n=1 Tax=Strongylocentrotus purpuratus TaxID=7668 RepID=A0A7M7T343_STRPU|nr:uncharacterized protein LOC105438990 [Strongylocentrotus purpuratus]
MRNSKSSPKSTNKKDILINESAVKEMIHTYCFQTRGADIKKTATVSLRQLLLRAGDVEMNPGPKYRSIGPLQERELLSLAHDVSPEYYNTVCIALGFTHARSKIILTKNLLDVSASVFDILCMWKTEQTKGSDCRRALVEILRGEGLNLLANKISEGIYKKLTEQYTSSPTTVEIPTNEYRDHDSDNLLKKVAEHIQKDTDIYNLGGKLEFDHSEIKRYMEANKIGNTVTYMGTLDMLHDWKKKTKRSEEREKLKKALNAINHQRLADDLMNDDVAS